MKITSYFFATILNVKNNYILLHIINQELELISSNYEITN